MFICSKPADMHDIRMILGSSNSLQYSLFCCILDEINADENYFFP